MINTKTAAFALAFAAVFLFVEQSVIPIIIFKYRIKLVHQDREPHLITMHSSLLVKGLEYNALDTNKNCEFSDCKILYDQMQWDRYDAIRDDKRFAAVLDKISRYC